MRDFGFPDEVNVPAFNTVIFLKHFQAFFPFPFVFLQDISGTEVY